MKSLIIYFVPENKYVGGGIISIFSLAEETRNYERIHHSDVVISVLPGYESYKKK